MDGLLLESQSIIKDKLDYLPVFCTFHFKVMVQFSLFSKPFISDLVRCSYFYPNHQLGSQKSELTLEYNMFLIFKTNAILVISMWPSLPGQKPVLAMWIKCLAQGHNTCSLLGSNPRPLNPESNALPLNHSAPQYQVIDCSVAPIDNRFCHIYRPVNRYFD